MRRSSRLLVLVMLVCVGCGYSTESLIDPAYKTVYVKMFDNRTFYRGFEQRLTRQIINQINTKTHLRIAPHNEADTVLSGVITDFKKTVLTEDGADHVRELQIALTVDMTWTNRRTGAVIRHVPAYVVTEDVKYELGETLEGLEDEAFEDMAEQLIERLEKDW